MKTDLENLIDFLHKKSISTKNEELKYILGEYFSQLDKATCADAVTSRTNCDYVSTADLSDGRSLTFTSTAGILNNQLDENLEHLILTISELQDLIRLLIEMKLNLKAKDRAFYKIEPLLKRCFNLLGDYIGNTEDTFK